MPTDRPTSAAPAPVRVRLGRAGLEAFRHGETWHDVTAWSGPERLAPRWWVRDERPTARRRNTDPAGAPATASTPSGPSIGPRDYYSARTADGALWLLFSTGTPPQWFAEGWWD